MIQKYPTSICEQLCTKKSEKAPPSAEEQKAIAFLKSNPQVRTINSVAAPIAKESSNAG